MLLLSRANATRHSTAMNVLRQNVLQIKLPVRSINMSSTDSDPVSLASEGLKPDPRSVRREALWLYRDVLRTARQFTWPDKDGVMWKDKLVASARKEFEIARHERDPAIISQLLIGGRDALMQVSDRMLNKARRLVEEERASLARPGSGNGANGPRSGATQTSYAQHDANSWKQSWETRHDAWEQKKPGK
jgi:hypothetical protein